MPDRLHSQRVEAAVAHFERLGYTVLDRAYNTRLGTLPLVVYKDATYAFVDVSDDALAQPNSKHRITVRRMAAVWLSATTDRPAVRDMRFDSVGVKLDPDGRVLALDHLEGAF